MACQGPSAAAGPAKQLRFSSFYPHPFGIVGRAEVNGRRVEPATHVHLVSACAHHVADQHISVRVPDVGQAHAAPDGFAPGARGDLADSDPVSQHELTTTKT